jgi:hypothetical protein
VAQATHEVIFIITDDGVMGVSDGNIDVGDQLYVLYGGTQPFVLRQDNTGNHRRLVGNDFVDPTRFNDSVYRETGNDQWFSLM